MYLQSVQITNFRKFGSKNNIVEFVQSDYKKTVKNNSDDPTSKSFVACATTLIIGKNNAGKTTVTKALKQVIDNEKIFGSTFNLNYIKSLFDQYSKLFSGITKESLLEFKKDEFEKVELPIMKFKLKVGLDTDPKSTSVQNLSNVIPIEDNKIQKVIVLEIKFIVSEDEKYKDKVYKIFSNAVKRKSKVKFNEFLRVIDTTKFSRHIYDIKGRVINSALFLSLIHI